MRASASVLLLLLVGCGDSSVEPDGGSLCAASCDDGIFCNGAEECSSAGCAPGIAPCADGERCIETENRCEAGCATPDGDGDGVNSLACSGSDCDDTDPNVFPGAVEICDGEGIDEDCDPLTFGGLDADGDGAIDSRCCNGASCGRDCDDFRADAGPGAGELCNERDDDCDGSVDEGVAIDGFADEDGDRYGDSSRPVRGCPGWPGISANDLDCDDATPSVHGAQAEIRDGVDNDCDGSTDEAVMSQTWYVDADGDGFGDAGEPTMSSDEPIAGYSLLATDCDDDDADRTPVTTELCNAENDDCDARTVYVLGPNDSEDDDGDGWPDAACPGVDAAAADCDDRNAAVSPGAPERCNARDDDCDGTVDEDCGELDGGMPDGGCDGSCDSAADVLSNCGCDATRACVVTGPDSYGCAERGAGVVGDGCVEAADCAGDHLCRDGRCLALCSPTGAPCAGDGFCTRNLSPITYLAGFPAELGLCTEACDPVAETGCPTGQTCSIAATGAVYYPFCREVPGAPSTEGVACGAPQECDAGLSCDLFDGTRQCVGHCPFDCPSESLCSPVRTYPGGSFRFCVAR